MNNEAIKAEIAKLETAAPCDKHEANFIKLRLVSLNAQLNGVIAEQGDWIENEA